MEVVLVDMAWLKPHEEVQSHRVDELRSQFEKEGHVDLPLLVDRSTGTILDGHHRFTVGQVLGANLTAFTNECGHAINPCDAAALYL